MTGPDEYTALVDKNVLTHLMAARNLRVAADAATRYPRRGPEGYPLLLHHPYYLLYSSQVVKQADLVLSLYALRRLLRPQPEAAQLRLLRADHRARLLALGVDPVDRRG